MKEFISNSEIKDIADKYNIRRKSKTYIITNLQLNTNYSLPNTKKDVLTKSLEKALKRL